MRRYRHLPLWQRFICWAFERHIKDLHGADYEVCWNPFCWLAMRIEERHLEDLP